MDEEVRLVAPSLEVRDAYLDFHREWVVSKENMVPSVIKEDPTDFPALVGRLLAQSRGEGLPAGHVPSSTCWLLGRDAKVVGAVSIRHRLTEFLLREGGHIGYGIRPSERRKGYATRLLALSLERARDLGITRALVVCDEGNVGSERTIRNNGGVQDASCTREDGSVVLRFWIDIA